MNLLDLYEQREPYQAAIDKLEQRRIDTLNDRMQELVARARTADAKTKAALKQEFEKIKKERDSYYQVREAQKGQDIVDRGAKMKALTPARPGMAGAVKDVAQGLKNFLQGKPETGPTYEAQKKNSEQIDEYISISSDKNFKEVEPYKNYKIYVRRKPFNDTGIYTAHTEIDRKGFMEKGRSQEEAVQAIRDRIDFVLNAQPKVTGSSTIDFNVKFATDLLADPRQTFYAKLEKINGEPKLVIAGTDIASDPELLAAGDFKRSALRNQVDDEGRATPLPGIPLTAKGLRSGDWIANGRYTIGKETQDRDGNRVFDLTYHSTAHTKSDKLRLNQPAFTLGTAREVGETKKDPAHNPLDQRLQRLKVQARREFPRAHSDEEALLLKLLDKETKDAEANRKVDARQDAEIQRNFDFDRKQEDEIEDLQAQVGVREHGGGIGPKQRWQDLMPEQNNPEDYDWYDDEEDDRLKSGDYVRDRQDGEYGEIFRMVGDPHERRVQILDRDGKGWYISPDRLEPVDPTDPDIQRYFGKRRQRELDEEYEPSPVASAIVRRIMFNHPDLLKQYGPNLVNAAVDNVADYVGDVDEIGTSDVSAWVAQVERMLRENPPEAFAEGWSDAVVARRTGTPRTPYSVYIKGKKWKDFANDDHAEAVANKLKAKFRADGRDPETVTIAPTYMDEKLIEGIKDTASATAVVACLLAGGSLSGCATAPQKTTAQQVLKTGQDVGRTVQAAKRITRAGAEEEVRQELRNLARGIGGHPGELNNSNILRIWKRIKGAPPVQPEPDAPENFPAPPRQRMPQYEGKEVASKQDYHRAIDSIDRQLQVETNPVNKQILRKQRDMLQQRARAEGWIKTPMQETNQSQPAEDAILKRIFVAHRDLLIKYGPEKVMQAAEDVAYNVGDQEIGSSDVSGWVRQVEQILGARP